MPKFGDKVRIKGTFTVEIDNARPVGGTWNDKTGVVIRGPFLNDSTGSIDIYLVRLDPGAVEGKEDEVFYVKCLWNTLEYLGESPDKDFIEAQIKWENKLFNDD